MRIIFPPEIKPDRVRKLAEELERLTTDLADYHAATGVIGQAEQAHRVAVHADKRKLAEAIRSGQDEPTTQPVKKTADSVDRHQLRLDALAMALVKCEKDLLAAVDDTRNEWLASLDGDLHEAQTQFAAAVDALADASRRVDQVRATARWVSEFPGNGQLLNYRPKPGVLSSWRLQSGSFPGLADVFSALREIATPADGPPRVLFGPGSASANLDPDRARMRPASRGALIS